MGEGEFNWTKAQKEIRPGRGQRRKLRVGEGIRSFGGRTRLGRREETRE